MTERYRVIVDVQEAPLPGRWLVRIGNQSPHGPIVWSASWSAMQHCPSDVLHDVENVADTNINRMFHRTMGVIDPLF
jgi:hypothetical protein